MGAPHVHAELSVKRFGGSFDDYIEIHQLMDSSKQTFPDLRHRALTHNSWFVTTILEKIFGHTIKNSDGIHVAVREIAQWHVMEDYDGSFPSAQDFLEQITFQPWMDNGQSGAVPPSSKGLPPFDKSLLDPRPKALAEKPQDNVLPFANSYLDPSRPSCRGAGRID